MDKVDVKVLSQEELEDLQKRINQECERRKAIEGQKLSYISDILDLMENTEETEALLVDYFEKDFKRPPEHWDTSYAILSENGKGDLRKNYLNWLVDRANVIKYKKHIYLFIAENIEEDRREFKIKKIKIE